MRGRSFLRAARHDITGANEPCWRGAIIHAYYALFLECRDALIGWGSTPPPRQNIHTWVRLRFLYATDADLKRIGYALGDYCTLRNLASYDLGSYPDFSSDVAALNAIQGVMDALALLDAIEADPIRRAAAIASLPP